MRRTRKVTSIFHTAVHKGNVHIVRTMVESRSMTSGELSIALRSSIAAGRLPIVQTIIQFSRLDAESLKLNVRLCQAIRLRHEDIALWLLHNGAGVSSIDARGNSALMLAVASQSMPIVRDLLERGADVSGRDSLGNSIAMLAAAKPSAAMVRLVLQYGASPGRALARAIINNHYANVRLLLMNGADPNETNERGITPLILSMLNENVLIIKLLVQFGADLNRQDLSGDSALTYAARHCGAELYHLLVKLGASADVMNHYGETPADLYAACFQNAGPRSRPSFT